MQQLREFLLTRFEPLKRHLKKHRHRLFRDVEVMVGRSHEGEVQLFLPMERLKRHLEH